MDVVGRSGGLAFLWRYDGEVKLNSVFRNHIDVMISIADREEWRLTGFYEEPNRRLRRNTWELLRVLSQHSSLPWCVIGDMNNILSHEDKRGGRRYPKWLLQGFCEVVKECNLIDLDLVGHSFTWEKSRGTSAWVELRLDRALATNRWMEIHNEARLYNIEILTSDHSPILLEVDKSANMNVGRRFRFENAWLKESMCKDIVLSCWESNEGLGYNQKLADCYRKLSV